MSNAVLLTAELQILSREILSRLLALGGNDRDFAGFGDLIHIREQLDLING